MDFSRDNDYDPSPSWAPAVPPPPPMPNAFISDDGTYALPIAVTRDEVGNFINSVDAIEVAEKNIESAILDLPAITRDNIERDQEDEWDPELVDEISVAAADWNMNVGQRIATNELDTARKYNVATDSYDLPSDYEIYITQNPGFTIPDFNIRVFDLKPNNYAAFYARNQTNGNLIIINHPNRISSTGEMRTARRAPFIPFRSFCKHLEHLAMAALRNFGLLDGTFWQLQLIDSNTLDVIESVFRAEPATEFSIHDAIEQMQHGVSEGHPQIESMFFRIIVGDPGTGFGGNKPAHLKSKRFVWSDSEGEYCAPKSIIMCMSSRDEKHNYTRAPKTLRAKAIALCNEINCNTLSWGFLEICLASQHLKRRIITIDSNTFCVIHDSMDGVKENRKKRLTDDEQGSYEQIYLILDQLNQHFMACYNPSSLDIEKEWCDLCNTMIRRKSSKKHNCAKISCWACRAPFDTKEKEISHRKGQDCVDCKLCWRKIPKGCIAGHSEWCDGSNKKCPDCKQSFYDSAISSHMEAISVYEHNQECGDNLSFCKVCRSRESKDHRCKITRTEKKYNYATDKKKIYSVDIEAYPDHDGRQIPNLVIVREIVKSEEKETKEEYVQRSLYKISQEVIIFSQGEDCLQLFCEWFVRQKNTVMVAHNLKGYDGVMIHGHLRYTMGEKTEPVMAGLKVMAFSFRSNLMIDSLNHIACRLSEMPKVLGIFIPGLEKDHFPHLFHNADTQNYRGPLPDIKYYAPDQLQRKELKDLVKWHEKESAKYSDKKPWVLQTILERYCKQDTLILSICFGEYRRSMIELTGLDPVDSLTIASFCMSAYRNGLLPEEGMTTLKADEDRFARDALRGGRTEAFQWHVVKKTLRYIDVVSLYPTVQFYDSMPVGAPIVLAEPQKSKEWLNNLDNWLNIENTEGFARVDFQSPRTVGTIPERYYIPLLGVTTNGKLRFDREFHAQQVVPLCELREAVKLGYKITNVTRVDLYAASTELFKDYVRKWLKIKVESSEAVPEADIEKTIKDYKEIYGIDLDASELRKPINKGRRNLAKICLNSLWGRLGMRNFPTTALCDPKAYFQLMARWKKGEISIVKIDVDCGARDCVAVVYQEKENKAEMILYKTNAAVAAYVTAQARLRLYKVIGDPRMSGRVIYCDTDSCIYIYDEEKYNPQEGEYLGQWSSEADPGICFDESVALGPKTYAIRDSRHLTAECVDNHCNVCGLKFDEDSFEKHIESSQKLRCKGFRMTGPAEALITFDSLLDAINEQKVIKVVYPVSMVRTRKDVYLRESKKEMKFEPEHAKRRVVQGSTVMEPY